MQTHAPCKHASQRLSQALPCKHARQRWSHATIMYPMSLLTEQVLVDFVNVNKVGVVTYFFLSKGMIATVNNTLYVYLFYDELKYCAMFICE